jgi:Ca-activated chloride channel homolog
MTKKPSGSDKVRIRARWDKAAVAIGKGSTHLVVTIETPMIKRKTGRAPLDVAFVIDRSGSMSGEPLELAKRGVIEGLGLLADSDSFAVIAYDNGITDVVPMVSANAANKHRAVGLVREITSGGSTDLHGGWYRGCQHLHAAAQWAAGTRGRIRRTVLLTDGQANVGLTDPSAISWRVTAERQAGIVTSTIGVGEGFDEMLLTGMAEAGGGNFAYARTARDLPAFFTRELGEALTVIASSASISLTLPKGLRANLLNPFPVERTGKTITVALGDLPAGMTLNLVFAITSRAKDATVYPAFDLTGSWTGQTGDLPEAHSQVMPIDPLMAMSSVEFAAMPFDDEVARIASDQVASNAKREAMLKYRDGDADGARSALRFAHARVMSAPSAAHLDQELADLQVVDFAAPAFESQRKQITNDEHRQSRGREQ